jgi:hypothetical protein
MIGNLYASRFGDLLERRFSETADDRLAQLAEAFAQNGFGWLASRRDRLDLLYVLHEVNQPICEAMVME